MTRPVLILRPQPGASQTGAKARRLGLEPVLAPIFKVDSVAWDAPDAAGFEATMFTSANAARLGGPALSAFLHMPCYVVGESTAAAAEWAGFRDIRAGPSDGTALLQMMIEDRISAAFHPHGREHLALRHPQLGIVSRTVYSSDAVETLPPPAIRALKRDALALLHSPRAAALFDRLFPTQRMAKGDVDLALISEAAAMEAGAGWKSVSVAALPRDHALLELAAKLCKTDGTTHGM